MKHTVIIDERAAPAIKMLFEQLTDYAAQHPEELTVLVEIADDDLPF